MTKKTKTWLIVGGVALAVIIGAALGGGEKSEVTTTSLTEVQEEDDDTTPISELVEAYNDNEVAAKRKYKGQTLRFKGSVSDIGEQFGKTYVHLDYNITVHFYFSNPDVVAKLNKGDKIKVEATVGDNIGSIISMNRTKLVE